ncbi:hypothetical protein SPONN_26 [uncultured Candidatus Thioglobus sp.]|nr:hypothetical protein SPONN_26 [uncultured Candidatus Thioglobus sp.]
MKEKEQWELRLEEGMRTRWRDRRINYENKKRWSLEKKDQAIRKLEEKRCRQEVQKEIERNCQKEIMDCQTQLYNHEASKTIDSTAALLLPTVRVPDNDHETSEEIKTQLPISDLSGIDSVCVVDYIQNVEAREAKALRLAKHYRDLAESIRSKSIKKQFAMEEKVELVRSFWRNEIKEGSSRAGLMVRRALQRRQHRNEDS